MCAPVSRRQQAGMAGIVVRGRQDQAHVVALHHLDELIELLRPRLDAGLRLHVPHHLQAEAVREVGPKAGGRRPPSSPRADFMRASQPPSFGPSACESRNWSRVPASASTSSWSMSYLAATAFAVQRGADALLERLEAGVELVGARRRATRPAGRGRALRRGCRSPGRGDSAGCRADGRPASGRRGRPACRAARSSARRRGNPASRAAPPSCARRGGATAASRPRGRARRRPAGPPSRAPSRSSVLLPRSARPRRPLVKTVTTASSPPIARMMAPRSGVVAQTRTGSACATPARSRTMIAWSPGIGRFVRDAAAAVHDRRGRDARRRPSRADTTVTLR